MAYTPEELLKIAANYEKLAAKEKSSKLDPKAKVRNRGTVCVPASSAKDKKDHFPINDMGQARNALARVEQLSSAPWYNGSLEGLKALVKRKVHAKYPSIGKDKKSSALADFEKDFAKYAQPYSFQGMPVKTQQGDFGSGVPSTLMPDDAAPPIDRDVEIAPNLRPGQFTIRDEEGQTLTPDKLTPEQWQNQQGGGAPANPGGGGGGFSPIPKDVQNSLNSLMQAGLKVDGKLGPATRKALDAFKASRKMPANTSDKDLFAAIRQSATNQMSQSGTAGFDQILTQARNFVQKAWQDVAAARSSGKGMDPTTLKTYQQTTNDLITKVQSLGGLQLDPERAQTVQTLVQNLQALGPQFDAAVGILGATQQQPAAQPPRTASSFDQLLKAASLDELADFLA